MDLTKITTPFGLLDDETREALLAWPNEFEYFSTSGIWKPIIGPSPSWCKADTIRARPLPQKPREFWLNVYTDGYISVHPTQHQSNAHAASGRIGEAIHVREVMEGEAQ